MLKEPKMEDMQTIIDKISKCLALSKSANEHEAAVALKQAQTLMQKYKISEKQILISDIKERIIQTKTQRTKDIERRLKVMIANVFECGSYSGFYTLEGVKYQQHVFMELNQMCLLQHMHIMFYSLF